jgi:hypothetical protein
VVLLPGELTLLAITFCYLWSSGNHRFWFPWLFRVKVAGHVVEGSIEL